MLPNATSEVGANLSGQLEVEPGLVFLPTQWLLAEVLVGTNHLRRAGTAAE
jgi:hypothetical protein